MFEALIAWIADISIAEWGALLAIATTVVALSQKARNGISWAYRKAFPTREMLRQHIIDEEVTFNQILSQLVPNGSTSLRDAIDRIEHKQHDLEAFLAAQLNVHSVAIVRTDSEGKLTYANRAYQRLFGVSMAEVIGEGWVNVIHPTDRDRVYHLWQETVIGKREFNEDIMFMHSNGERIPGHATVYRELDQDNEVRGWVGVIIVGDQMCFNEDCYNRLRKMLTDYENIIGGK
jgi:PAS domain S-box-containing protein